MTGNEHPIYFMGEVHYGDPRVSFYPVTVLWRMAILTSIGLLLFAIALAKPWRRNLPQVSWVAIGTMLLVAALYLTGMALSLKKTIDMFFPLPCPRSPRCYRPRDIRAATDRVAPDISSDCAADAAGD